MCISSGIKEVNQHVYMKLDARLNEQTKERVFLSAYLTMQVGDPYLIVAL